MKSPMWYLQVLLANAGKLCSTDTSRDYKTLSGRFEHEGMSLLTITLPSFSKAFENWLEIGRICPLARTGFKTRPGYCCPEIFSGMLGRVFDIKSGLLLPNPDTTAILCIRQICLMWKKVELECSDERKLAAVENYVKVEEDLRKVPSFGEDQLDPAFRAVASFLWPRVLKESVRTVSEFELNPNHGKGNTADIPLRNARWQFSYWHSRLEPYFPYDLYGSFNANQWELGASGLDLVYREVTDEQPVKVVFVPKTLKTPRVIAMEPAVMQYIQQGVLRCLVRDIESHPLTRGLINFSDQGVNRGLALKESKVGNFATLDLSEASDRVLASLVSEMLDRVPVFRDAVFACRSRVAQLGDGRRIDLLKFASMGSALCFPIEAMLFYTIIIATRVKARADQTGILTVRKSDFCDAYVYGDDIIVPVSEVEAVGSALARYGLKLNTAKCFSRGKFRESCGMDAYDGVQVKPVYLRRMPPTNRADASRMASIVSFTNQLEEAGWTDAAREIRTEYGTHFGIPYVTSSSPLLGWVSPSEDLSPGKWCQDTHRKLVYGPYIKKVQQPDKVDGFPALLKCIGYGRGSTLPSQDHLERSPRPRTSTLRYGWRAV